MLSTRERTVPTSQLATVPLQKLQDKSNLQGLASVKVYLVRLVRDVSSHPTHFPACILLDRDEMLALFMRAGALGTLGRDSPGPNVNIEGRSSRLGPGTPWGKWKHGVKLPPKVSPSASISRGWQPCLHHNSMSMLVNYMAGTDAT